MRHEDLASHAAGAACATDWVRGGTAGIASESIERTRRLHKLDIVTTAGGPVRAGGTVPELDRDFARGGHVTDVERHLADRRHPARH